MKLIELRVMVSLKSVELIKAIVEQPPAPVPGRPGGLGMEEITARARLLKALRKNVTPAGLLLEDNDHKTLVDAAASFRFGLASEDLDQILCDIREAKEPPAPANLVPVEAAQAPATQT